MIRQIPQFYWQPRTQQHNIQATQPESDVRGTCSLCEYGLIDLDFVYVVCSIESSTTTLYLPRSDVLVTRLINTLAVNRFY